MISLLGKCRPFNGTKLATESMARFVPNLFGNQSKKSERFVVWLVFVYSRHCCALPFLWGDTLMGSFRKEGVVHPRTRTRAFDQVVGTRLRAYRNELGLSQTKFADRLHISAQQLQKYETGVNSLSLGRAVEVSDLLGVSLNKLAGVNGVAVGLTAIERLDFQIQNEIRKFNDASKPRVLHTLKNLQRNGPS